MSIGSVGSPVMALQPQAKAALAQLQQSCATGGGGSGAARGSSASSSSASSSSEVVSETSTVSATGVITTIITYANGQTETTVTYGPPPASTFSVFA